MTIDERNELAQLLGEKLEPIERQLGEVEGGLDENRKAIHKLDGRLDTVENTMATRDDLKDVEDRLETVEPEGPRQSTRPLD